MIVELIYESSCPNVAVARTRLLEAFQLAGLPPTWREWDVNLPDTPQHLRRLGSPSILVDGKGVGDAPDESSGISCRLYATAAGYESAPAVVEIAGVLCTAMGHRRPVTFSTLSFASLPSIAVALLPKLTCPICWPAYTALLGSIGVSFVNYTPIMLPVLAAFLSVSLLALAYRARIRRGFGPFWLGLGASLLILGGKFWAENDAAVYLGSGLLVGASLWNMSPRLTGTAADARSSESLSGISYENEEKN